MQRSWCGAVLVSLVACSSDGRDDAGADGGILTADADGSGDAGSGSADGGSGTGQGSADGSGTADDGDDGGVKFDLAAQPDAGPGCGPGEGGGPEFSYLWAANSAEGTISKIDTNTVEEVGRFIVRPDSAGSPSRTSVSLSGHVVVANRNGGITKIYATPELCQESNGMPGIQTSTTASPLAWGQDECLAWHTPFNYSSQRPVAWTQGTWNEGACRYENERVWTSGLLNNVIEVLLLDGDTGVVIDSVQIDGLIIDGYGIYGGAVDGVGNFWGSQLGSSGRVVKVDIDDLSYEVFDPPDEAHWYGMTVDSDGYVWLCSSTVARFDPAAGTWLTAPVGGYAGCMADAGPQGLLWMSSGSGVIGVNRQTLAVERTWTGFGSYGISIDHNGFVWAVANGGPANRVDPDTGAFVSYDGLVGAYTYSDMTGFALSNAGTPSG